MQPSFEDRLKKALAGRSPAEMNEFQFLNLDMVKAESGDRWIEVRKKVYGVAAHFVEKRMQADDVVLRCRGGFILIFARLSAVESRARLEAISQELNLFFLGDRILRNLDLKAEGRSVDAAEFARFVEMSACAGNDANPDPVGARRRDRRRMDDGRPNRDARWMAGKSRAHAAPSAWPREGAPERAGTFTNWQGGSDAKPGTKSGSCGEDPGHPSAGSPEWKNRRVCESGSGEALPHRFASVPTRPSHAPEQREAVRMASYLDEPCLPPEPFADARPHWDDIVFKPCWDAKLQAITSNICLARRTKDGVVYYGSDTLMGSDDIGVRCALDRAVAMAAQRGYQQLHAQGESCLICIPVHYSTIRGVADRVSYFSILQTVPPHLRHHFYLRVDHIPADAPISQMQDLFRSMKWFGSNLVASLPFGHTDMSRFEACGIDIFSCDVPAGKRSGALCDADIAKLGQSVKAAKEKRAATVMNQTDDFEGLVGGLLAGVRGFAGDAVGHDMSLPMPERAVTFTELFERSEAIHEVALVACAPQLAASR